MRNTLAVALTLLLAATAIADTTPVAPRVTGPDAGSNIAPIIVPSGNEFVVLWRSSGGWRFARIRSADQILFTGELPAGDVADAVAGPNNSVLVAIAQNDGIHLATIATNGDVTVSGVVASSFSSFARNGSRILIVTRDGDTVFTDTAGHILGSGPKVELDLDQHSSTSARGSGFVVTWPRITGYVALTLTSTGSLVREQILGGERQIGDTGVGCNSAGTCLLLTAVREPLSGQILSGNDAGPVIQISEDYVGNAPRPVWDGQRFLVAWNDYQFGDDSMHVALRVDAIAPDGTLTHVAQIVAEDRNRESANLAYANGEAVVVWTDSSRCGWGGNQIMARSLATSHKLRLTSGLSDQGEPAIAAGHDDALIAWTERGGDSRIRARRYPLTAPAFDVSAGPASAAPAVATDGTDYLVAWRESLPEDDCHNALRISIAGSGEIHTLGHDVEGGLAMTWNGSEYAVVWEQANPAQLFGMRIDREGHPIDDAPVALSTAEADPDAYTAIDHEPAGVFWNGSGYTLLWRRSRVTYIPFFPDPPPQFDTRLTMLAPNLIPTAPPRIIAPAYYVVATRKANSIVALWTIDNLAHAVRLDLDGTLVTDTNLGIPLQPRAIVATRTGYAVLTYNEVLSLNESLVLVDRRESLLPALAETSDGLLEVRVDDGSVVVSQIVPSPVQPRRRRSIR